VSPTDLAVHTQCRWIIKFLLSDTTWTSLSHALVHFHTDEDWSIQLKWQQGFSISKLVSENSLFHQFTAEYQLDDKLIGNSHVQIKRGMVLYPCWSIIKPQTLDNVFSSPPITQQLMRGLPQEGCGERTLTRGLWWEDSHKRAVVRILMSRVQKLSAHSHHIQWNLETRIGWLGLRLDNMGHSHFAVNNLKWERISSAKPWLGGRMALNTRSYTEAWTTERCMLVTSGTVSLQTSIRIIPVSIPIYVQCKFTHSYSVL